MRTLKPTEEQVAYVNNSVEKVLRELRLCHETCLRNNMPLRGISFVVRDDDTTKVHITYKRR